MLAFTLAQLVDGIPRGGRLSSGRYEQLGGVQGALTRRADAALIEAVAASGRSREQVIAGVLRLVTIDEQGRPTRSRVNRDELADPVPAEWDAFVARQLLITDTENGSVVVEVAHEAFLSAWPPLAQAITAAESALRARRAVKQVAAECTVTRTRLTGCGSVANSPLSSPIPAPGSTPVAGPQLRCLLTRRRRAGSHAGCRGGIGCWLPTASTSARRLAPSCTPVSVATATNADAA